MSDLFLGEMLVIVLLIPVLLRPFFRSLQRIAGIPVLPLLAFLSCFAIIAGSGFRLSFLPVFIFVFFVFISGLPQLVRMIRGLPTDWYSPVSIVWDCILLIALVLTLKVSWQVRPELSWLPTSPVTTTRISEKYSAGVTGDYVIREPSRVDANAPANARKIVVLAGPGFSAGGARATLANILAGSGWTVIEANYRGAQDYRNVLFTLPSFRTAFVLGGLAVSGKPFFTDETEIGTVAGRSIERLVGFAHEKYGVNVPVYAIIEGASANAFPAYIASNARSLAGSAVLLSASDSDSFSVTAAIPVLRGGVSGMMPAGAGSYPVLALSGDDSSLFGYGELCADDVLAAKLLHGVRDEGRKQAEITGRKIATWLDLRRSFNDGK
jgi:hypothetical protein